MSRGTPVRVNRALTRPRLTFGMERKPLFGLFIINLLFLFGAKSTDLVYLPPFIMIIGIIFLIRMNKKDPQIFNIYLRLSHFKQSYYAARSGCLNSDDRVRA